MATDTDSRQDAQQDSQTERRDARTLWRALRRIYGVARPYRGRLALALAVTATSSLVMLTVPLGVRELIDAVFEDADGGFLNVIAVALLVLLGIQIVFSTLGRYLLGWTGARIVSDLRERLYEHLHTLGLRFFADNRTGDLASRLTSDVDTIRAAVTNAFIESLLTATQLVGSMVLMVFLNWRLSLLIFLVVPAATVASAFFGRAMRRLARQVQDELAKATGVAEEALGSPRLVKAFAREPYEVERYRDAIERMFGVERSSLRLRVGFGALIGGLFSLALIAVFWFGGREVLAGRLSAGDLVAFIFYAFGVASSVGAAVGVYTTFQKAAGASERLFELLDTRSEIEEPPHALRLPRVRGAVTFESVTFAYDPGRPVLQDLSFQVEPGETVALVGPSGAGKTTTINLIPRFYDVTRGCVCVDGHDVRTLSLASLRGQVALVPQDVQLFNATVADNIRYGRLDASDADVEAAARAANAHAFISELPGRYASEIGERGVKLSGGQRQRLAIARAVLADAPILLLDEATSSLDSHAEALVQDALERLMRGRTTFVIAHRLATVRHADRILVFRDGRIVQAGTHDELFAAGGLYRDLALMQFQEAEA